MLSSPLPCCSQSSVHIILLEADDTRPLGPMTDTVKKKKKKEGICLTSQAEQFA